MIICSECKTEHDDLDKYCMNCGHKLKKIDEDSDFNKKYCRICGEVIKKDDDYCGYCGYEIPKMIDEVRICPVCGEWCDIERYCWNCRHDFQRNRNYAPLIGYKKKCPHCNTKHEEYFNYCEKCGTKLIEHKHWWDENETSY